MRLNSGVEILREHLNRWRGILTNWCDIIDWICANPTHPYSQFLFPCRSLIILYTGGVFRTGVIS
jgi:hypothetical protein